MGVEPIYLSIGGRWFNPLHPALFRARPAPYDYSIAHFNVVVKSFLNLLLGASIGFSCHLVWTYFSRLTAPAKGLNFSTPQEKLSKKTRFPLAS